MKSETYKKSYFDLSFKEIVVLELFLDFDLFFAFFAYVTKTKFRDYSLLYIHFNFSLFLVYKKQKRLNA